MEWFPGDFSRWKKWKYKKKHRACCLLFEIEGKNKKSDNCLPLPKEHRKNKPDMTKCVSYKVGWRGKQWTRYMGTVTLARIFLVV